MGLFDVFKSNAKQLMKERDIDGLVQLLLDNRSSSLEKLRAATYLCDIGDESIAEPLIGGLEHENDDIREHSAWVLGEIRAEKAVEPLIQTLNDGNWQIRLRAVEALCKLHDQRAVEPIRMVKINDENNRVRNMAVKALRFL